MRLGELVLFHLSDLLCDALGDQLLGLYVHGSYAPGVYFFDEHSDLDVLAVLAQPLGEDGLTAVAAVHDDVGDGFPDGGIVWTSCTPTPRGCGA